MMTHSALPSPLMSPAVTNSPDVNAPKVGSTPIGSLGGTMNEPSLPLTMA